MDGARARGGLHGRTVVKLGATVNSQLLDLDSWTDLERQVDPVSFCSVLRPPPSLNCASSSCARRSARLPSPAPGGLGREPSSEDSHLRYAKRATCPHARARGADQVALDKEEQPRGTEHGARSTQRRHGAELTVRRLSPPSFRLTAPPPPAAATLPLPLPLCLGAGARAKLMETNRVGLDQSAEP